MFRFIIVQRRVRRAIADGKRRGYIQDGSRGGPAGGTGGVERQGVDEGFERGASLARRGRHIQRAMNGFVEKVGTADQRQDLPVLRIQRHQRGVVDILAERALFIFESCDAAFHNLFGEMLGIQIECCPHDETLTRTKTSVRDQPVYLILDDPDEVRRFNGIGRRVEAQWSFFGVDAFLSCDIAMLLHQPQDNALPFLRQSRIRERVIGAWRLRQPCQQRTFGQKQVAGGFAKIRL